MLKLFTTDDASLNCIQINSNKGAFLRHGKEK